MAHEKTALVLGATGGIGGEVARRLVARGWQVRALNRNPAKLGTQGQAGITWIQGDAMHSGDVVAAARDVSLVVHAVNPPGYRKWSELVLPMLDNSIAAARASGARLLLPGTVYNFGPDSFPEVDETTPQRPITRKGAIRVEMERRLEAASRDGIRVLIVRAGDFFGPKAANNWFSQGLVKPGRPVSGISYPGKAGIGHQWAYLPDVAETMLRLIERDDQLAPFAVFHMEGHWDADGTGMIGAIRRAAGKPGLKAGAFPWWLIALASPVVPLFQEMREMRYLWQVPLHMGNARLKAVLGEEPHTPLDEAVRTTLRGLGSLA